LGQSAAALPLAEDAIESSKIDCGKMNIALISQFADLAAIYQGPGCYDDSEKVLRQIIAIK